MELSQQTKQIELSRRIGLAYTGGVKPVWTPFNLAEEMLSQIELRGSILVLSDLGFIPVLKWRGADLSKVTFVAHTEEQAELASQMRVGLVLQVGYNSPIKELEKFLVGMKFDVVVGNPPYGNLHLPILKKCVEHLSEDGVSITIQPVRWLQDPLWKHKKSSDAMKMKECLEGKLDSVKVVPSEEATKMFAATLNMDLGIFTVKARGGRMEYAALSKNVNGVDISPFARLIEKNSFLTDEYDGLMKHFVPLATIAGSGSGRGFVGAGSIHQIYGYFANGVSHQCKFGDGLTLEEAHKTNKRRTFGKTIGAVVKQFDTAEEAKNFYQYIKLDVFRFFIYITTLDVHIQSRFLPFPSEKEAFKTAWDEDRFCSYFKINQEERAFISAVMKNIPPIQ